MTQPSPPPGSEYVTREDFELLAQEVRSLRSRVKGVDEALVGHAGDVGASGMYYPHPYQSVSVLEIGANFFRGEQGFFQMNVGLEQRGGLVFVDEFIDQDQIGSYSPLNSVEGRADGVITHLQLVSRDGASATALLTIRGKATQVIEGQAFDGTNTGKFQLYPTYFQVEEPLQLNTRTADPSSFADGWLWYRTDTDKFRARINGATENLATEAYADAAGGGMKVQNEGYEVYPSAAAGIDPANSGSAWTNGAWSEVIASTAHADYVVGISFSPQKQSSEYEFEIDIGTGAAAAEAVKSTIPNDQQADGTAGNPTSILAMLPFPIAVASSTRLAVRCRSSSTSLEPRNIKLIYVRQANLVAL